MDNFYSILIVEDMAIQAKKLQYVLKKFGYRVTWATNGLEALAELEKEKFSLIISDFQMPEMDGLQLLGKIKNHPKFKRIPFVLLTTIEDDDVFLNSLRLGANEFLNKPYRSEELEIRCRNLILLYEYQGLVEDENKNLTEELIKKKQMLEVNLEELRHTHNQLKNTQEQLIQLSKRQSLGTLGAGMAHEINNPLSIIKTCNRRLNRFLDEKVHDDEKMNKINTTIETAVDRIMKIVKHLKSFAEGEAQGDLQKEEITPVNLLTELSDFFGGLVAKNEIEVVYNLEEGISFFGYRSMIEQIFLNLIHNSIDAMEESEKKVLEFKSYWENDFVVMEVCDTGCGIADVNKDKIFDPFFTTKPPRKGVGMGLGMVRSYLESHKGHVAFESVEGNTIFKIYIPKDISAENEVSEMSEKRGAA